MKNAEAGQPVALTRRGKRVAVIVSVAQYARLAARKTNFWDAYVEWRRTHDLKALDFDPDEIYGDIRDRSPGREPDWM